MLSQHIQMQSEESYSFKSLHQVTTIYQLAKEKNEKALTNMVDQGYCLGIFHGEYNAVIMLAKDGDNEAIEFLLSKFSVNIHDAVFGYALGGRCAEVEDLIARGANLDAAVKGYACAGNTDKVEDLIARGADLDAAVEGYARGGYADKVEDLILRRGKLSKAARGYACGGYVDKVEGIIARDATSIYEAACGYASAGYTDKVEDLISRSRDIFGPVFAYAHAGYTDQVEDLISREPLSSCNAARAYAQGGHAEKAEDLIVRESGSNPNVLNHVAEGYAQKGYVHKVEDLISRGAKLVNAAFCYAVGEQVKNHVMILKVLSFTKNISIRQELAETIQAKDDLLINLNRDGSFSAAELLREAAKLNQLRKENQMDFKQAYLFRKPWMMHELHIWFLQGIQLVKEKKLTLDLFIYISAFVAGLSFKDTNDLFKHHLSVMPQKLHDVSIGGAGKRFERLSSCGMFSHKKITKEEYLQQEQTEATDRYKNRMSLI